MLACFHETGTVPFLRDVSVEKVFQKQHVSEMLHVYVARPGDLFVSKLLFLTPFSLISICVMDG